MSLSYGPLSLWWVFLALCYRVMIYLERSKINQQARVALCYTWGSYLFSTVISKLARHIYLFFVIIFYFFMTDTFNITR